MQTAEHFPRRASPGVVGAVRHSLLWLVLGNAIGVMLAVLLLLPELNRWLGEWTYGRWLMVHMNTALFGWCSLPLVAFLFRLYAADRNALDAWSRPILWLWSGALVIGSLSWLSGHSSGKLFLDWSGYARVIFSLALGALWLFLAIAFMLELRTAKSPRWTSTLARALGLVVLSCIPFAIYVASSPTLYPAVNPDSGGPTGTSQLESSLGIVLILLVVPCGLTHRKKRDLTTVRLAWTVFVSEVLVCATLGRADLSHRIPVQFLSLGSLLVWLPLIPVYYNQFQWHAATGRWRRSFLWWWGVLVVTGWVFFLPGVLDRFKFTDGLVGHSFLAAAGFLSAFVIFVMVQLIGEEDAWIFNRRWSFYAWNCGVLAYVIIMTAAGWIEGGDATFTIVPGPMRDAFYLIRLIAGLAMLAGSLEWLVAASSLATSVPQVKLETSEVMVT